MIISILIPVAGLLAFWWFDRWFNRHMQKKREATRKEFNAIKAEMERLIEAVRVETRENAINKATASAKRWVAVHSEEQREKWRA